MSWFKSSAFQSIVIEHYDLHANLMLSIRTRTNVIRCTYQRHSPQDLFKRCRWAYDIESYNSIRVETLISYIVYNSTWTYISRVAMVKHEDGAQHYSIRSEVRFLCPA